MKKFLKKIVGFVGILALGYTLVFLLIYATFKYVVTDFHKDKGNFANDYNNAFKMQDAEILILGSSRAAASLDANLITKKLNLKCYNLAFTQSNMTYSHHLLQYYLTKSNKKPAYIILDMSWFSFDKNRLAYKEYASYFVFNSPSAFQKELLSTRTKYIPMGITTILRSLTRNNEAYVDFQTHRALNKHKNNEKEKSYEFAPDDDGFLKTFPLGKSQIDDFEVKSYQNILAMAKANGINVLIYISPEDELFSNSQKNRQEVYSLIYDNSEDHKILDYSLGGNKYAKEFELLLGDSHHIYYNTLFTDFFITDYKKIIDTDLKK